MEIEIYTNKELTKKEYLNINKYNLKFKPDNLFFVNETTLGLEDNSELPMQEIYKVQFIASCKTKFDDELLIAFYIGEFFTLCGYLISELPRGYYNPSRGYIVDYKSYLDICDLTGETKMSFMDYCSSIGRGVADINTYVQYNDKYLNRDDQKNIP